VVPLILLGIRWILAKLYLYGLVPSSLAKLMNLNNKQQQQSQTPSSCCSNDNGEPKRRSKTSSSSSSSTSSIVVKEIQSEKEFDELLSKNEIVVVKFTASWCKPCHNIQPYYQKKCEEYPQYNFLLLDVDELDTIAAKYKVAMMPTFLILQGNDGTVTATYRGSNEFELDAFLKENLPSS
jgi:thioredoxin 1